MGVDVRDYEGDWCRAKIVRINNLHEGDPENFSATIKFLKWNSDHDTVVPFDPRCIRELHTITNAFTTRKGVVSKEPNPPRSCFRFAVPEHTPAPCD